jgi:hypothetical protein
LPEWLIERGIGETRAALVDGGKIIEARIALENAVPAGSVVKARLHDMGTDGRNAVAIAEAGVEYLLPRGAPNLSQGATLSIEVTREAIPGTEPWKRPLARMTDKPLGVAPAAPGRDLAFPSPADELGTVGWNELVDEARTGRIAFAGGELRISPTPAMTLIDVDGYLPPDELAQLGAAEAARAVRRLDIGGSIGIDLPTVAGKADRQAVGEALDRLLPKPFERTAMNGFGFLQVVRPRSRPSLIELAQDRAAFEARALLRRAALEGAGARRLVAHPALTALLEKRPDWLGALSRQLGGTVSLRAEAGLPMSGGYAEQA